MVQQDFEGGPPAPAQTESLQQYNHTKQQVEEAAQLIRVEAQSLIAILPEGTMQEVLEGFQSLLSAHRKLRGSLPNSADVSALLNEHEEMIVSDVEWVEYLIAEAHRSTGADDQRVVNPANTRAFDTDAEEGLASTKSFIEYWMVDNPRPIEEYLSLLPPPVDALNLEDESIDEDRQALLATLSDTDS